MFDFSGIYLDRKNEAKEKLCKIWEIAIDLRDDSSIQKRVWKSARLSRLSDQVFQCSNKKLIFEETDWRIHKNLIRFRKMIMRVSKGFRKKNFVSKRWFRKFFGLLIFWPLKFWVLPRYYVSYLVNKFSALNWFFLSNFCHMFWF